jgi:hypothetical protein
MVEVLEVHVTEKCGRGDAWYCISGVIYGYCTSEYCGGGCSAVADCKCVGCDDEDCCNPREDQMGYDLTQSDRL